MRNKKTAKELKLRKYFMIFAFIIIPLHSFGLASNASWTHYSLSYIANYLDAQGSFILWGIITGSFFFFFLLYLLKITQCDNQRIKRLNAVAYLLLLFSITTPYLPEVFPFKAFLHIVFSFLSPVLMVLSMYLFIFTLMNKDHQTFRKAMIGLNLIVFFSSLILFVCGIINSLLEVFFTISMCLFLIFLMRTIDQSQNEE